MIGIGLSFFGPFGEWVLLNSFAPGGKDTLFLTYIFAEISALLAFRVFGFILGTYADRVENLAMTDRSGTALF